MPPSSDLAPAPNSRFLRNVKRNLFSFLFSNVPLIADRIGPESHTGRTLFPFESFKGSRDMNSRLKRHRSEGARFPPHVATSQLHAIDGSLVF